MNALRLPLVIAGLSFVVFLRELTPGLSEIDAGELATVAHTLGVAHPSGYPLFACVGRIATMLGLGAPIFVMNLLSALFAAGAAGMLVRVVADVLPPKFSSRSRQVAGATAGLAFALHPTLRSAATVTEVHALQMFLDTALLHAVVRAGLWSSTPFRENAFLVACYVMGLTLTNHLTGALLVPVLVLGLWKHRASVRRPVLVAGTLCLAAGLSMYLVLPIRSAFNPIADWGNPETLPELIRHVAGMQYHTWMFSSSEVVAQNARTLAGVFTSGGMFLWLPLGIVGLFGARQWPGFLLGSTLGAACCVIYPLGYEIHDIETYFLPGLLFGAIWVGVGAAVWSEHFASRHVSARALPLLLPVILLAGTRPGSDSTQNTWVDSAARAFLETPAENAFVISTHWDILTAPALYLQVVEKMRSDVVLFDTELLRRPWYLEQMSSRHPDLFPRIDSLADLLRRFETDYQDLSPADQAEFAARIQPAYESVVLGAVQAAFDQGRPVYVGAEVANSFAWPGRLQPAGMLLRCVPRGEVVTVPSNPPWPELPVAGPSGGHLHAFRSYVASLQSAHEAAAPNLRP